MTHNTDWANPSFWPGLTLLAIVISTSSATAAPTAAQQQALRQSCRADFMSHCSGVTPGGADALRCLQKNVAGLSSACQQAVRATMPRPAAAAPPPKASAAAPKPAAATTPPPKATATAPRAARSNALNKACGNDYLAHCANVPPGGKEAVACLRQHAMALSVPCKEVLSRMMMPAPKKAVGVAPPPAPAPKPAAAPVVAGPTPKQLKALKFTCRHDFRAHCRGVPPGGQAAFACLARNSARLTQNCRTSVRAIEQSVPAPPPPSAAAPPPTPAIPLARIERMPVRERLMIARACDQDQAVVCPGVPLGGGRLIICLASHPQSLSPRCGRALRRALY